jgi:hypothetical protein
VKLHVLTAVSRPGNLSRVAESLATAAAATTKIEVCWHWRFDLERTNIGGQALKNAMLDEITDGWIWCLDDDTLAHEDVLRAFEVGPHQDAFILSQRRVDRTLIADPSNVRVGEIDIGQAMLRREWIGDRRIPIDYNGDGMFLREVLHGARVVWVPEPFSLHNAISQVVVSV